MFTADQYANQTNPLTDEVVAIREAINETVSLGDRRLARITRLRLLTEPGYPYYDVSYVYGELRDGTPVRVTYDGPSISRRTPKASLLAWAKDHGVYAKGLGLLDENNWSKLW